MSSAPRASLPIAIAGLLAAGVAHDGVAADVVVYRCVSADGAVTLQNDRRCPKGSREQRRVIETPVSPAVPAVPAATRATPAAPRDVKPVAADASPVVEIPRTAPPAVFACRTWEGTRYFADSDEPAPRCAPLETVGLDGRGSGVALACEVVADTCEPVAEAARCDAWAERLRNAEDAARFGDATAAPTGAAEATRLRGVLAGSTCAPAR